MRETQDEMKRMRGVVGQGPKKIFGPHTIASAGGIAQIRLEPAPGGGTVKNVVYFIRVWETDGTFRQLGMTLEHAPDAAAPVAPAFHSNPISLGAPPASLPAMMAGSTHVDNGTQGQIGEWLFPVVEIDGSNCTALIEVFEQRKVF